jgi:hypothetical protein
MARVSAVDCSDIHVVEHEKGRSSIMATVSAPLYGSVDSSGTSGTDALLTEVKEFHKDCRQRLAFNTRWDNVLNVSGILLSVAIIASGAFDQSEITSILGGLVAAIVTAQRAFPFGSRVQFYRVLVGQTENLMTDIRSGAPLASATITLKSLRLDFAQQLPRGSSFSADDTQRQ